MIIPLTLKPLSRGSEELTLASSLSEVTLEGWLARASKIMRGGGSFTHTL
ncbi:hypothetical protein LG52_29 [Geobacillus kaustophilus]|jgi:hypothetical protein|uniref:Uncharacterized protein n=1 Tax=Geobacillus kaustophilus TaxID=1462 RepID=A0A0D8BWD6_GEOKU|nr:hypothetical protein LG52_29 [Geobacillus kaustophilus]